MIRNPGRFTITVIVIVNIIVLTIVVTRFLALSTKELSTQTYVFMNDENDPLRNKTGRPLKLRMEAEEVMEQLHDVAEDNLDMSKVAQFPVAIAASSEFFLESMLAVYSVHSILPGKEIVYYDLGLKIEEKEKVLRLCNVTYKTINLNDINMMHINDLSNFAYKIFVFHDMLLHNEAFLWLDPTVQLTGCFSRQLPRIVELTTTNGIVLFDHKGHSVYSVTHPQVFNSLPSNLMQLQKTDSYGTGIMMVSRQREIVEKMLQWLLLCSLNRACIIPYGHHPFCGYNIQKPYTKDINANSQGCHLYDQAIINVLLANQFTFDTSAYTFPGDMCFEVSVKSPMPQDMKYC